MSGPIRIAVIGGTGQVGQEFAKFLPASRLQILGGGDIRVEDPVSVSAAFSKIDAQAVVNLAAFHNTDQCESDPRRAFEVNAAGAHHVATEAAARGLVCCFFSSDYVFGGDGRKDGAFDEAASVGPINVYGVSKVAGEQLTRLASPRHLVVRTSSLFGAVTSKKGWTFPELMLRKAASPDAMRVVADQRMAPTYTRDLVARVLELLDRGATGTYHIANSGECSWWEFATETLAQAGVKKTIEPVASSAFPTKARRPAFSALTSIRAGELGLSPMRPWQEALSAYLIEKGAIPDATITRMTE